MRTTLRTWKRIVAAALLLSSTLAACGEGDGVQGEVDCSSQVRADGIVYTSHSYSKHDATKHSTAERAACEDIGKNAAGSVFRDDAANVTTWTFAEYPPEKVLGVASDGTDSFAVFIADSVPPAERDRIYEVLAGR